MLAHATWLLLLLLLVLLTVESLAGAAAGAVEVGATRTLSSKNCVVRETDRIGCGATSIAQSECIRRGCCYLPAYGPGAPSCFFSQEPQDEPSTTVQQEPMGTIGNIQNTGTTGTISSNAWTPRTPPPNSGKTGTAGFLDAYGKPLSRSGTAAATTHASTMSVDKAALPLGQTIAATGAMTLPAAEPLATTVESVTLPAAEPLATTVGSVYTLDGTVSASLPLAGGDFAGNAINTLPTAGGYAMTMSTTTAYFVPQRQTTAVTTVPVVVDKTSFTTIQTTTHFAAPLVPLGSVTEITTSTTTAYSAPPVTTSTTTAYVAVTASYVAVVMDTPPYGTGDQPHGTGVGVGSNTRRQIHARGGGNTSKVGMIILSVLTALLVLVALAAASQCILNFLRNVSSKPLAEVSSATQPLVHSPTEDSSSMKVLPHLPPILTQCTPLDDSSELYEELKALFESRWNTREWPTCESDCCGVRCPIIREIWEIEAKPHFSTYLAKQAEIDDESGYTHEYVPGNEQMRFHGARIKCHFNGTPCEDATCNVCRIIEDGNFQSSSLRSEIRFTCSSHAAKGYGLAPGKEPPPRNLNDFVSSGAGNAVFIAGVLIGTPEFVTALTTDGPEPGSHSRVAADTTGVDEVVIFDAAQAIPKALVLFQ